MDEYLRRVDVKELITLLIENNEGLYFTICCWWKFQIKFMIIFDMETFLAYSTEMRGDFERLKILQTQN